jgi:xanthine dehydrogenase small subunit
LPVTRRFSTGCGRQSGLTGSKEGCGEGDCGACTVVVARRQVDGTMRWHPVNACIQFMGMLEGASVTTIEGLQNAGAGGRACRMARCIPASR